MKPDVSFVTSCYNGSEFLDDLIDNIQKQSHENYEHIIIDSCSTDDSRDIAKRRQHCDPRIKIIEQPERTPYGISWLEGWRMARGYVVTNSNCDDRSYPWRATQILNTRSHVKAANSGFNFYYGGYETRVNNIVISKGTPPPYSENDLSQFFRCGVHVHWDGSLRDIVDWQKMFKAGREYKSAFDYWLVLYFISLGAKGIPIPSCFSVYNQRANSIENSNKEQNTFESVRAITEFYPDGIVAQNMENRTRIDTPDFYNRYKQFLAKF